MNAEGMLAPSGLVNLECVAVKARADQGSKDCLLGKVEKVASCRVYRRD